MSGPPPLMFSSDNFQLYSSKLGTNQELNITSQYGPLSNIGYPPVWSKLNFLKSKMSNTGVFPREEQVSPHLWLVQCLMKKDRDNIGLRPEL